MVLLLVPASLTSGTTWEVKVHHVIEAARLGEVVEFWRSDGHCGNRQDFMITVLMIDARQCFGPPRLKYESRSFRAEAEYRQVGCRDAMIYGH
jgi:hypothetical protein